MFKTEEHGNSKLIITVTNNSGLYNQSQIPKYNWLKYSVKLATEKAFYWFFINVINNF